MSDLRDVVITGVGIVAPLGQSPADLFDSLLAGRSAIAPVDGFDTSPFPCRVAARVKGFKAGEWVSNRKNLKLMSDAVRFGSMISVAAGEYLRFQGQYTALGDTADFTTLLASNTSHDVIFHAYNPAMVRLHQHLSLSMLAHMLTEMDALVEPNGRSVLDNSLVLLATEYGQNHDDSPALHGVLGGDGRFNPGWYEQPLIPSDIYHQAMAAYGIDSGIPRRWPEYVPTEIAGLRNV